MRKESGRVNRLSATPEPKDGLGPSGFDPSRLSPAQRRLLVSLRPAGFGQYMAPDSPNCLASCQAMRRFGLIQKADDREGADAFVRGRSLFVRLTTLGAAVARNLAVSDL